MSNLKQSNSVQNIDKKRFPKTARLLEPKPLRTADELFEQLAICAEQGAVANLTHVLAAALAINLKEERFYTAAFDVFAKQGSILTMRDTAKYVMDAGMDTKPTDDQWKTAIRANINDKKTFNLYDYIKIVSQFGVKDPEIYALVVDALMSCGGAFDAIQTIAIASTMGVDIKPTDDQWQRTAEICMKNGNAPAFITLIDHASFHQVKLEITEKQWKDLLNTLTESGDIRGAQSVIQRASDRGIKLEISNDQWNSAFNALWKLDTFTMSRTFNAFNALDIASRHGVKIVITDDEWRPRFEYLIGSGTATLSQSRSFTYAAIKYGVTDDEFWATAVEYFSDKESMEIVSEIISYLTDVSNRSQP